MRQCVEARAPVVLQHVVHPPPCARNRERVQGLVRTAPRPEPVGETPKILLVDLLQDSHHRLLDNLVVQGGDAQRTLSSISLRDGDPPGGLCSISPAVHSAVEVGKPMVQAGLIRLPGHAILPGSGVPRQRREAVPEHIDREMVESGGALLLVVLPCGLAHASQSLGHACPARCRVRVGSARVLLGPRASRPPLRRPLLVLVRGVPWYDRVV